MTQLHALLTGLDQLRRFRAGVRQGSAWALWASILLISLLPAFGLDVWIGMGRVERAIVLLLCLIVWGYAFARHVLPALRQSEDDLTLALLVERRQGLSSDLVAALQFADRNRPQFGSPALRHAVIDTTAEVAPSLDYLEGFDRRHLARRALLLAGCAAAFLLPVLIAPGHALAFLQRFVLLDVGYPTRTTILAVESPGDAAGYGRAVEFRVRITGLRPDAGTVDLRTLHSNLASSIVLLPDPADPTLYTGRLERALDDLAYTLRIGDAYPLTRRLRLMPLPAVKVELQITTPDYARGRFNPGPRQGNVALEGSRVVPVVTADKPLRSAVISLDGQSLELTRDLDRFLLDRPSTPDRPNPLDPIAQTVRYEAQVVDADGLSLDRPVSGMIQVRPDLPPRVLAMAVTRVVIPDASPTVRFGAADDYGLSRVVMHRTVLRAVAGVTTATPLDTPTTNNAPDAPGAPGATNGPAATADAPADGRANEQAVTGETVGEESTITLAQPDGKVSVLQQAVRVDLAPLNLSRGDRVLLSLEAFDHRGSLAPRSTRSEQIVFEVTDREGVLEAMKELDAAMDRKLDQIIRAQLGLGD